MAESAASITKTMKEQQMAVEVARGKESGEIQEQEDMEKALESQSGEQEVEMRNEEVGKLSKAVEDISVEELEKEMSVRKKGCPSKAEKKDKAAKQRELDRKKGKGDPTTE